MYYVELLRARRALTWYCGILLACAALGLALAFKDGPPHLQVTGDHVPQLPISALLIGSAFGSILLAAFMAVGLDAEFKTAAIAWTRPITRLRIAASYLAVDIATLFVAWAFTVIVALLILAALGFAKYLSGNDIGSLALWLPLTFGVAMMWYGLVLLCTMLLPGRGNAMVGASWAYALFVPGLAAIPFPPLLHRVMVALNYLNPLAYLSTTHSQHGRVQIQSGGEPIMGGSVELHLIAVWIIAAVAVEIATRMWTAREVPA